ncbi:fumarylacetoacetate hydrolase family protein [Leptospirillum ferriphilum]|jgi:2-keto-4-pentenoate hydratase/2-oxohepta-3-ene-1,7-dioic acid hydratase in catechol pathway|uniref:fumarylacetoacetate hydrolase family protein n=1 Tax=Leptospirillum ferriphilum TaxID=178606 RepID=UPI0006B17346|nr:fumarylacetoacetate hydrolase family protein [Leptospirillum ferriphilum]
MMVLPEMPPGFRLARFEKDGTLFWGVLSEDGSRLHPLSGPGHGSFSLLDVRLHPPVTPGKIIAVGLNYRAHGNEMGKPLPEEPLLFMKATSALLPPNGEIRLPRMSRRVDFEGEIALVMGKKASGISPEEVPLFVYGITCANDVTARDLQKKDVQYTRAKSFDTFCPLGPVILTGALPDDRRLRTEVNGVVRQDARASDMIFDPLTLVSFISQVMTLEPGDVILTGTPSGVGPLSPMDRVSVSLEGVGSLVNVVGADPHLSPNFTRE